MSLYTLTSSFCAVKPKVWLEGDTLCARSSLAGQTATLFFGSKYLRVDPQRRMITLRKRSFWFLRSERIIPFDDVWYLLYDMGDATTSWGFFFEANDNIEWYKVSLVLRSGKVVRLFSFWGEGSAETGWAGVIFGDDDVVDYRGDQDEASYDFLRQLRTMLDVPVNGPPKEEHPDPDEIRINYKCADCGKINAPTRPYCQYCGGPIQPVTD